MRQRESCSAKGVGRFRGKTLLDVNVAKASRSPLAVSDALSHFFPGRTTRRVGIGFGQPSVKIFALIRRELECLIFVCDAVPEFFH